MNEQFDNTNQISTEVETAVSKSAIATTETTRVCRNCQATLTEGQKFCPNCGTTIEGETLPKTLTCTNCGAEVPSETKFCPKCGTSIVLHSSTTVKEKANNKKKLFLIGGIVAAAVVIATIIILCFALREIPVEDIVLSETTIELKEEETKNVSCTVYPEKATDKTVTWTSSDNSVATVNSYGMITAVGKGTCTITAKSGEQSETIKVTVKSNVDFEKLYDDYCNSTWATLGSDKSYLSLDTNPYDYDDGDYRYSSTVLDAVRKIHKALNLPDSLYEDMMQTSWGMGKQEETFENIGVKVTWTYHPDKGLEVTYKLINN